MRFGVCAGIESAVMLADCGCDYIELAAAADLVPEQSEAEWSAKRREIDAMPIRPEVFNSFVRVGKIVGSEADPERLGRYVSTALRRAAEVGGKVIVLGSGGARSIPEGWPVAKAHIQMLEFLGFCASASAITGVVVVIEPLCRAECNYINLVSEGAALAREKIRRPGAMNLADTYHMEAEGEPLFAIVDSADILAHVHTADTGRFAPGTGVYDHIELFRLLRQANYDSRISIECSWQGRLEERACPAIEHLRSAHRQASER